MALDRNLYSVQSDEAGVTIYKQKGGYSQMSHNGIELLYVMLKRSLDTRMESMQKYLLLQRCFLIPKSFHCVNQ